MKRFLITIFLLDKILCECYERCITCTEEIGSFYYHNCLTCKEEMYLLDDSNNCYYIHELPGYYLYTNNIFYSCSENCYECIDNSDKCKSCNRGYEYNKELNSCSICSLNKYIYVLDGIELCQGLEKSIFTCELKFTTCTDVDINTENYECPRDYPLFLQDNGVKECSMEIYNSSIHIISNEIIKTQWLNKITQFGGDDCWYLTKCFSSQGDLIIESNEKIYNTGNNNGRLLFYDKQIINLMKKKQ